MLENTKEALSITDQNLRPNDVVDHSGRVSYVLIDSEPVHLCSPTFT